MFLSWEVGMGAMIITAGPFLLIEFDEHAFLERAIGEETFFVLGAVAPKDFVRRAEFHGFADELEDGTVDGVLSTQLWSYRRAHS